MKKSRWCTVLLIIILVSLTAAGCSQQNINNGEPEPDYGIHINGNNVTFTDARGKELTIPKNPKRVVCLDNSCLDLWYKCGGKAVGRVSPTEDKPVEEAKDVEIVGDLSSPSVEKILFLEPDLVIIASQRKSQLEAASILEQNNIDVLMVDVIFKEDYFQVVRLFTVLTGREDLYEKYAIDIRDSIEEIIKKVPKDENHKVLILFATAKDISTRDSNTTVGQMVKDLGAVNISDTDNGSTSGKIFSMEKIIEEDPDFVFVQTMGSDKEKITERIKKDVESNPAWSSLKAVKEGRYIILPKDLYLYKANDRYHEAYEGLAKILYPGVFK